MKTLHFLVPTVRESFHFFSKVVWLGCQNCIPHGNRIILWRSMRFDFSPSFLEIEQKIFDILLITYRRGCKNCILRVQKNTLISMTFAKNSYNFVYHFRTFRQKNLAFWQKNIAMFVKKCILTVHWNNLRRGFLWKPFSGIFRARAKFFGFFSINFVLGCQNCVLRAQRNTLKDFPEWISSFQSFSDTEWSISGFLSRIFSEGSSELYSTCLKEPFKEKIIFGISASFGPWSKEFGFFS